MSKVYQPIKEKSIPNSIIKWEYYMGNFMQNFCIL